MISTLLATVQTYIGIDCPVDLWIWRVSHNVIFFSLNLEQGRFLASFAGNTPSSNVCAINNEHQLIIVGGTDGIVEAWDPRSRQRVGKLDCIRSLLEENCDLDGSGIEITALTFRDGLNLAVGSSKGFVQLFDLRASSPLLIKDHQYGLPVKKVNFVPLDYLVLCKSRNNLPCHVADCFSWHA